MRFVWSSALKDLRRQLRDPLALLFWAGVPALIAVLIVLAFGGREARAPRVELLVADEDSSFVSRLLIGSFGQTQLFDVIPTNRATGRRRLDRGRGSALLVIPRGFGQALLEEAPTTLELIKNPAQEILPEIAQQYVEILTDASFYAQRLFGEQIRAIRAETARGGAPSDSLVAAVSVGVRRRLLNAGRYLAPPVLSLQVVDETPRRAASGAGNAGDGGNAGGKRAPATDGLGFLFYPGILFMAILFSAQGVSADLWLEKTRGTLRKAMTTPGGVAACLAGKIVAGAIIVAGICTVAAVPGAALFGLPLGRLAGALLFAVLAGSVFVTLLLLVQTVASSQRTANLTTSLLIMPLQMLGGSFFPFEIMPPFLARIGRLTPNGFALEQVKRILQGAADPATLLVGSAALLALGAAAFLLMTRRLRRGFAVD